MRQIGMTRECPMTDLAHTSLNGIHPLKRLVGFFDRLVEWQRRAAARRHLAALSERELKDIGLSRLDAWREAGKPFWRA